MVKIELGNVLADDEHTAADGAYLRMLRARKWLYIVAVVASLHATGILRYDAIGGLSGGALALTPSYARIGLLAALVPLTAQYVALLIQFGLSFKVIMAERLSWRNQEKFDGLATRIRDARAKLEELGTARAVLISDGEKAATRVSEEKAARERGDLPPEILDLAEFSPSEDQEMPSQSELTARRWARRLTESVRQVERARQNLTGHDAQIDLAERSLNELLTEQAALEASSPERKSLFRAMETLIDASRAALPLLAALHALGQLVSEAIRATA